METFEREYLPAMVCLVGSAAISSICTKIYPLIPQKIALDIGLIIALIVATLWAIWFVTSQGALRVRIASGAILIGGLLGYFL